MGRDCDQKLVDRRTNLKIMEVAVMKHRISFSIILAFTISLLANSSVYGQDLTGVAPWSRDPFEESEIIYMTEDVRITKPLIIKSGVTLTLLNVKDYPCTIYKDYSGMQRMIEVHSGGKLIIKGNQNGRIIIDGMAGFTVGAGGELVFGPNTVSNNIYGAVINRGTMELDWVTIQQVYGNWGVGIMIDSEATNKPNGTTTITNSIITKCYGKSKGVSNGGSAILITNQSQCSANTPLSCAVRIENSEISYCEYINGEPGGTLRTYGTAVPNLYLTNVVFHHNRSYWGAGLYWNAHGHTNTKCVVDGCTFRDNIAYQAGGGMMLETTVEFVDNTTKKTTNVYNNTVQGNMGGGVYIKGYAGGLIAAGEMNIELSDKLNIYNNTAPRGGGIGLAFDDKMTFTEPTTINVNIDGCNISGNTTNSNTSGYGVGGGIYCLNTSGGVSTDGSSIDIKINLNSGTITNNTALYGGGALYVDKTDVTDNHTSEDLFTMSGNKVTSGNGGALYLENGNLTLGRTNISNNTASGNGGGIYVNNTDFSAVKTVTLSESGKLENNTATLGGGMFVEGNVDMTYSGNIIGNKATNGGGIFVRNGAKLTIGGGLIRLNRAIADGDKPATGYQKLSSELNGMGGGIYLGSGYSPSDKSELVFSLSGSNIGVYNNDADWGGDDLFANGSNTTATLPNISEMNFSGFDTPTDMLYWAEDYITDDTRYGDGTKINTSWIGKNARYDDAIMNSETIYHLDFGSNPPETDKYLSLTDKYLSLEVGYELIILTLTKYGLLPGDNAVINFTPARDKVSDTEYKVRAGEKVYRSVVLMCTEESQTEGGVVKKVAIPSGWWKVDESTWSWMYTPDNGTTYDNPIKLSKSQTLKFRNEVDVDVPGNDEDIEENKMKSNNTRSN